MTAPTPQQALHILSRHTHTSLLNCTSAAAEGDSLVLIGDGVHNGGNPPRGLTCYALRDDVATRKLPTPLAAAVKLIDYPEFVELCSLHQPVCSW